MRSLVLRRDRLGLVCLAAVLCCALPAAQKGPTRKLAVDPSAPQMELFAAIEQGLVSVRLVQNDETAGNAFFTNHSGAPLTVQIPPAFVGQHILAQAGLFQNNPFGQNQGNQQQQQGNAGAGQTTGVSASSGQNAQSGNNQNIPTFFSIPAERVVQVPVKSVCLEHGKTNPHPRMTYHLAALETYTQDPLLQEFLKQFGSETQDQAVVQAAAWHVANHLSWETLAAKRVAHAGGFATRYFTDAQIKGAKQLVERAQARVAERHKGVQVTSVPRL